MSGVHESFHDGATRRRPAVKARASAGQSPGATRNEPPDDQKKPRRTFITPIACSRCRAKKSKCDGKRPVCGRCEKNDAGCVYDVVEKGITRMQSLQQNLEDQTAFNTRLEGLFNVMRSGTESEAISVLAQLRVGMDVAMVAESWLADVRFSHNNVGSEATSSSPAEQRQSQYHQEPLPGAHSWDTRSLQNHSWPSWDNQYRSSGHNLSPWSTSQLDKSSPTSDALLVDFGSSKEMWYGYDYDYELNQRLERIAEVPMQGIRGATNPSRSAIYDDLLGNVPANVGSAFFSEGWQ